MLVLNWIPPRRVLGLYVRKGHVRPVADPNGNPGPVVDLHAGELYVFAPRALYLGLDVDARVICVRIDVWDVRFVSKPLHVDVVELYGRVAPEVVLILEAVTVPLPLSHP